MTLGERAGGLVPHRLTLGRPAGCATARTSRGESPAIPPPLPQLARSRTARSMTAFQ
ncbi:MAG: hypothetical protein QOD55_1961 [Solirubrobacteraceae bacterium]|nr:hypothetical protein [Solirubrobacteraceae bacterium]